MRIFIASLIAGTIAAGTLAVGAAQAQTQQFQGIAGELPKVSVPATVDPGGNGLAFEIDRTRNRELEKATGVIPAAQSQFYRPSILTGQRARRTRGTGIPIFDKLFTLD